MKFNHVLLLAGLLLILIPGGKPSPPSPDPAPAPVIVTVEPPIKGGDGILIVYEASATRDLPYKQVSVLTSGVLRDWAKDHGVPIRVWAKSIQLSGTNADDQRFKEAVDRAQPSLPWLYVSLKGKGLDQKLPADIDATIAVLEGVAK